MIQIIRDFFNSLDERFQLILIGSVVGALGACASVFLTYALSSGAALLAPLRGRTYGLLLPAIGAALSAILLRRIFKEAGGNGVTEAIYSISRRGGLLRSRSVFSRLFSSLLTIASGGSAGPEAPVVVSGAGIGSNVSNLVNFDDRQRFMMVAGGAAGALGAIFNAPLAGIAFSLEVVLAEWNSTHFVAIAVAAVVGTEVSRLLQGNQIPFQEQGFNAGFPDLMLSVVLAILCALVAICFVRLLHFTEKRVADLVSGLVYRAALGGLLVGILGFFFPVVLGEGYATVREMIRGTYATGLWIVGLGALAKVIATSLTLGSGGSGGVFAPCLVIGGLSGVFFQRAVGYFFSSVPIPTESYYAFLGMAGVISSALQAPLTGIFLIIEITGSYEMVLPVLVTAVVAAAVSHCFEPYSVYHRALMEREGLFRPRTDRAVLADIPIAEVIKSDCMVREPEMQLTVLVDAVKHTRQHYFPVVENGNSRYMGLIDLDEIRGYLFNPLLYNTVLVAELANERITTVSPGEDLLGVMEKFDRQGITCLPVVQGGRFVGLISKSTVLEHYRKELIVQENP